MSPNLLHSLLEVSLPTLRQSRDPQGTPDRTHLAITIPLRGVQACDFRNRYANWVSSNHLDFVTGADFSLMCHGEVKTCPPTREESLYHVVRLKSHTEFVARQARLRDNHFCRTDRESVANMD